MTSPRFIELLELQDLDVRLDQLRHRRNHHPLAAELRAIDAEAASQREQTEEIAGRRHELDRQQKRLDDEIALLDARRADIEAKLYDGSVTATKDLLALQAESAHLGERKRGLEDQELEIMEALEPVVAEFDAASGVGHEIATRRAEKEAELTLALGDVQHELEELEPRRAEAAAGLDADLLSTYEQLRSDFGGVAVARFAGTTCSGCHLSLSAMEVDRIRHQPEDAMVRCPECNRLLVR